MPSDDHTDSTVHRFSNLELIHRDLRVEMTSPQHIVLPLELKLRVLEFCDVETLGRTSQVSLALLQLSGPLLYRHIVIHDYDHLQRLIRSEVGRQIALVHRRPSC